MKPLDLFRLSFRNFKTKKMRSFLTIMGIGVGIGAILFLVAMGYGLQNTLIQRITTSEALLTLDVSVIPDSMLKIDRETTADIKTIQYVQETSPSVDYPSQITYKGITADATAHFVDDKFFLLSGLKPEIGEDLSSSQAKEAVVSSAVLTLLNLPMDKDALGYSLNIAAFVETQNGGISTVLLKNFKIKGIIKDDFVSYVYVPITYLGDYEIAEYSSLKVMVDKTNHLELVRENILGLGFQVASLSDIVDQANRIFRIMQIILAIFGIISLVVAAIGMFNTMTIALLERTQEIGIMKAIGASNIDIWGLFLAEAILIGFLGGLSGLGVGFGGGWMFNFLLNFIASRLGGEPINLFYYPIWFVVTIVIFSTLVGIFTGLYPAKRAAKLNPLDALRYK